MGISKRTRFEVFKRCNFTCQYCGRRVPDVVLHVDHVTPRAEGGSDDPENLTAACMDCNLGKGTDLLCVIEPEEGDSPLQEVSIALARVLDAIRPLWAYRQATPEIIDALIVAYCDADGPLLYHGSLPASHPRHAELEAHQKRIRSALARLRKEGRHG